MKRAPEYTQIHMPHWKGTVIRKDLLPQLLKDYEARGHDPKAQPTYQKDTQEIALYCPGMVLADRRWLNISLEDGFVLSFPFEDAEFFLGELKRLEARTFSDGTVYYKLHGWIHCMVLDLQQRLSLIKQMEVNIEHIRKVAKEQADRFTEAMQAVQKASGGRVVRVEAAKNDPIPAGTLVQPANHEKN